MMKPRAHGPHKNIAVAKLEVTASISLSVLFPCTITILEFKQKTLSLPVAAIVIFRDNCFSVVADDALAPCIATPAAPMQLAMNDTTWRVRCIVWISLSSTQVPTAEIAMAQRCPRATNAKFICERSHEAHKLQKLWSLCETHSGPNLQRHVMIIINHSPQLIFLCSQPSWGTGSVINSSSYSIRISSVTSSTHPFQQLNT